MRSDFWERGRPEKRLNDCVDVLLIFRRQQFKSDRTDASTLGHKGHLVGLETAQNINRKR